MNELGDLGDWIWFGVVAVWLLMRILPRLVKGKQSTTALPAKNEPTRPRIERRPPRGPRTSGERMGVPELPGHEQDPQVRRSLQNPTSIDPR